MPAERITMRKLREILRLISVGDVPIREIARRTGAAPSTIRATIERIGKIRAGCLLDDMQHSEMPGAKEKAQ